MAEMIDRVADAVLRTLLDRRGIRQPLEEIRGSDPETWAELRGTIGRLAIEALREPTEEIRWVLALAITRGDSAEDCWRRAINIALATPGTRIGTHSGDSK